MSHRSQHPGILVERCLRTDCRRRKRITLLKNKHYHPLIRDAKHGGLRLFGCERPLATRGTHLLEGTPRDTSLPPPSRASPSARVWLGCPRETPRERFRTLHPVDVWGFQGPPTALATLVKDPILILLSCLRPIERVLMMDLEEKRSCFGTAFMVFHERRQTTSSFVRELLEAAADHGLRARTVARLAVDFG